MLSYSDLRVTLYVLDLDYSLMLIKHTDLDLATVILLDRVQKHKPISAEAVKMLRSKQLVEGRKNALIVAKSIAQATEQEAEYSKAKGFSKEFCCNLILKYCCPLKVSEQRDIHPQCCCNGIADDFSEGKPLS